jgi:hypothetical protein
MNPPQILLREAGEGDPEGVEGAWERAPAHGPRPPPGFAVLPP